MKTFEELRINGIVIYKPQPKQQQFHNAILNRHENGLRDFLYGGAARGGKSLALRFEAHRNCLEYPKLHGLLIRSSFPELYRSHLVQLPFDLPGGLGSYNEQRHSFKYYNNSILEFGYGSKLEDFAQYLSAEYDFIMVDELTTIPFDFSFKLRSRLSASRSDFIPFWACATNPGDIAHSEVKAYFVDKMPDSNKYPGYNKDEVFFLPATVYDNQILLDRDPGEEKRLKQMNAEDQKRFLLGDWSIFQGMFFSDFRYDKHIIDYERKLTFPIIAGLDYGNTTVLEVLQVDYEGDVVCFFEIYIDDAETPSERASRIADLLLENKLFKLRIIYDTDMEVSQISNVGFDKTPIQIFRHIFRERMGENAPVMQLVNKTSLDKNKSYREFCNDVVKEYLHVSRETGQPKLFFSTEVKQIVKEITEKIIYDPKNPDGRDFLNSGESKPHAFDSLKYSLVSTYKPKLKQDEKPVSPRQQAADFRLKQKTITSF